jgi:hypothetical protein
MPVISKALDEIITLFESSCPDIQTVAIDAFAKLIQHGKEDYLWIVLKI